MVQTHSVGSETNEATGSYSDNPYVYFTALGLGWLYYLNHQQARKDL